MRVRVGIYLRYARASRLLADRTRHDPHDIGLGGDALARADPDAAARVKNSYGSERALDVWSRHLVERV